MIPVFRSVNANPCDLGVINQSNATTAHSETLIHQAHSRFRVRTHAMGAVYRVPPAMNRRFMRIVERVPVAKEPGNPTFLLL